MSRQGAGQEIDLRGERGQSVCGTVGSGQEKDEHAARRAARRAWMGAEVLQPSFLIAEPWVTLQINTF